MEDIDLGLNRPNVNLEDIRLRRLWMEGLSIEVAVIEAFNFHTNIFPTIGHLNAYAKGLEQGKEGLKSYISLFFEDLEVDPDTESKKEILEKLLDSKAIKNRHQDAIKYIDVMQELRTLLKEDLYNHLNNDIDSPLKVSKKSFLGLFRVNYEFELNNDSLFETPFEFNEYQISYQSLYEWFLAHGIEINKWKDFETFKKKGIPEYEDLNVSNKRRRIKSADDYFEVFLHLLYLAACTNKTKYLHSDGALNFSMFIEDKFTECDMYPNTKPSKSVISRALKHLIDNYADGGTLIPK